jgi:hypothetical protein
MLKALETHYGGWRFRSRMEARWAVFMDALKIRWRYEPEGFATEVGPYLPDFFAWGPADARCKNWILEVKPGEPSEEEVWKLMGAVSVADDGNFFPTAATVRGCFLIGDPPGQTIRVVPKECVTYENYVDYNHDLIKDWSKNNYYEGMLDLELIVHLTPLCPNYSIQEAARKARSYRFGEKR